MPRMYIISGCNGSGKTTASYTLLPELLDCSEFVNSDEFAKSLAPFHPETAYITASRYMLKKLQYLFSKREDFCIETTLATRSLVGIIGNAKELGYTVTILYFWVSSPELALARVHKRVLEGGHNIPENVLRRRYEMGLKYFFESYAPICDRWILADNSSSPFRIVAEGSSQGTFIRDEEKYKTVRSIVYPDVQSEQQ